MADTHHGPQSADAMSTKSGDTRTEPPPRQTPEPPVRHHHLSGNSAIMAELQAFKATMTEKFADFARQLNNNNISVMTKLQEIEQKYDDKITALEIDNKTLSDKLVKHVKAYDVVCDRLNRCERLIKETERNELENEQYSRKNSVRVFGLPTALPNENSKAIMVNFVNEKLAIVPPLRPDDIEVAHRVGAPTAKHTQTLLCKFMRRTDKVRVITARKTLKGTGFSISDDIAKKLMEYMEALKERTDIGQIWFWNGKLFAKPPNCNNFFNPRLHCDVHKLVQKALARPPPPPAQS